MLHRFFFAAALVLVSASAGATTYTIESRHTQGVLRWNHLGFSNPTAHFSQVEGSLDYDPAHPTQASTTVTIPIAELHTGVPDLDDDFHSQPFFDLAHFPTARFVSTKVEKSGSEHLKVTGNLTLRNVTKPVALDVTLNKIGINPRSNLPSIGFEATGTLKRSDFGLGLFVPQVSDEIRIEITAEGIEAKAYAEYEKKQAEEEAREAAAAKSGAPTRQ